MYCSPGYVDVMMLPKGLPIVVPHRASLAARTRAPTVNS